MARAFSELECGGRRQSWPGRCTSSPCWRGHPGAARGHSGANPRNSIPFPTQPTIPCVSRYDHTIASLTVLQRRLKISHNGSLWHRLVEAILVSLLLANLTNFVRQEVRVPKKKPLLPVFEAVSNALDAIAERGGSGRITITVARQPTETDGTLGAPETFTVEDDGVGFTDDNMQSFDQLSTDHKAVFGGKGRGRFAWLKVFECAEIDSVYQDTKGRKRRAFTFSLSYSGFNDKPSPTRDRVSTVVRLKGMDPAYASNVARDPSELVQSFISHFLPALINANHITIELCDSGDPINLSDYVRSTLMIDQTPLSLAIGSQNFQVLLLRLHHFGTERHRLILAAHSREVKSEPLERSIPILAAGPLVENGVTFIIAAILQGGYLDETVDPMRTGFQSDDDDDESAALPPDDNAETVEVTDIHAPPIEATVDLFGQPTSFAQVKRGALQLIRTHVRHFLAARLAEHSKAVEQYVQRDGMGYHFIRSEIDAVAERLRSTDDVAIEAALHRRAYEERARRTDEARKLIATSPKEISEQQYFLRWHTVVGQIGDVAKSDLANYVAHRRAIIDLVEDALKRDADGATRREEVLHSIVFPKGNQSGQVSYEQQNLWLIDERLTFHEHIFSDISIRRISGGSSEDASRPDLAIFETGIAAFADDHRPPTQLVLVELKRPGRENASRDDPVRRTLSYVRAIREGKARTEGGAQIDVADNALVTVYILADWTPDFRSYLKSEDFTSMPGDVARHRFHREENIIFIALSFSGLIQSARRRNNIFFKKLGI
jgi:histidine kinase/DNA gyrase B/HSP90-like ATPase